MSYSDPKFWFSAQGRVNRRPYFFAGLLVGCFTQGHKLVGPQLDSIYLPILLVAIYAGIVLGIKRCHDRGRTGWFMLLNLVPILNLWPMVELTFLKGDDGPNGYGPDPLAPAGPVGPTAPPVNLPQFGG